jgi:hypothetical protein
MLMEAQASIRVDTSERASARLWAILRLAPVSPITSPFALGLFLIPRMIRKSVKRFSDKIMRQQRFITKKAAGVSGGLS